ncbi:MAG: hypothetical protein C0404_05020 [Verrucomicrobia bacterium]|nr:hypothetical protein [Verrucomicrobiota bacterium]
MLAKAGNFQAQGLLSGSFIYAHPPDYRGRPSLCFTVSDWRKVFREFKEIGIETVIWQASAWKELRECYYPSKALTGYKQWNAIEPMIEAVRAETMSLYLGTFGVLKGEISLGVVDRDIRKAVESADSELTCFKELMDLYRGGFHGYYLSSETYYSSGRSPRAYKHYGAFFERVTTGVKEMAPGLRILASPATMRSIGREQEATDRMMECFGRAHVDCFAPMDCIGQLQDLGTLATELGVWKEVCRAKGAELWSNCESFLITDTQGKVMQIEAADPQRFLYQMTVADRVGAKRLITWEAMYFMNPAGEPKARLLRQAYQQHRTKLVDKKGRNEQ